MTRVNVSIFRGGSCRHPHGMVLKGASWKPKTFPSLFAALTHPSEGVTLFDTGYSERFFKQTQRFPERLYRWVTPVTLPQGHSAAEQLSARGISPERVKRVVLSHLHADHISGVLDFPEAEIWITQEAFESVKHRGTMGSLLRAFLPGLLPNEIEPRMRLLSAQDFKGPHFGEFGQTFDMFEDGSMQLVRLPGHAAGQVGLLARTEAGRELFFIADAAWTLESLHQARGPHRLANLILHHPQKAEQTLQALHRLWKARPDLTLVPSHGDGRILNDIDVNMTSR